MVTGGQTACSGGQANLTNAMVFVPEQPLPLSTVPNSVSAGRAGPVATAGATYSTTMHTANSGGIPDDVFNAHRDMQNRQSPHLNYMNAMQPSAQQDPQWAEFTRFRDELSDVMRNKLGVDFGNTRVYQKPYHASFDTVPFPNGWRLPDFVKFSGDDERTTWEHISQYIAQLGEIGNYEAFRVRLFSLSLTGTAFA
ncbi:hypothetical protein FA727_23650, partial [Robertmurraya kyonggiensis]